MKVCFLAGTLGQGGAERQLFYMLQALKYAGIETRVLCLTEGEIYENRIEKLGIEVEHVGVNGNRIARLSKIIGNLRKNRPDIIQSSHFYTNIYAAIAGKLLNIRSIGAIRSDLTREINADKIFGKWQVSLPDHLITNSPVVLEKSETYKIPKQKINLVKNAVNLEIHDLQLDKKKDNQLKVIFVGRLSAVKRPELFVELAFYLKENVPDHEFRFQIIGDGPLLDQLKQQAAEFNLTSNDLEFLGNQPYVVPFYQVADLLVLTSKFEGTPNVILEAMSFGLPILSTKVGGVPDIVSENRGILVDSDNKTELFEAAKKLLLDEKLRRKFGEEGKKFVRENHSIDSLQKRLIEIYQRILA